MFQLTFVWKEKKPSIKYAFATRKDSPYYMFLAKAFSDLLEEGHIAFEATRSVKEIPKCDPLLKEAKPLSLKKIFTVFLALALGVFLSMIVLITEIARPKPEIEKGITLSKKQQAKLQDCFDSIRDIFQSTNVNNDLFESPLKNLESLTNQKTSIE